eukprot:scaffold19615_cov101-Isochrysis_galbana.AAC.3
MATSPMHTAHSHSYLHRFFTPPIHTPSLLLCRGRAAGRERPRQGAEGVLPPAPLGHTEHRETVAGCAGHSPVAGKAPLPHHIPPFMVHSHFGSVCLGGGVCVMWVGVDGGDKIASRYSGTRTRTPRWLTPSAPAPTSPFTPGLQAPRLP